MIEDSTKFELTDELKEKIDNILQAHDYDYTQIVGILVKVQEQIPQHYIPKIVAYYIVESYAVINDRKFYVRKFFYNIVSYNFRNIMLGNLFLNFY